MKPYISKFILLLIIAVYGTAASAQHFRSVYFLEGATYAHQNNPAFMPERGYVSIPGLGKINAGVQGNVGLSNFIFPYDDPEGKYSTVTFLNSAVSRDEFLSGLSSKNFIEMNIDLTPLSFGFFAWGGYNTFDVSVRSHSFFDIPYELFDFLKTGMDDIDGTSYSISNLRFSSTNYAEIALGHSHKIDDKLQVGAKLKLLLGAGYVDANVSQLDLYMSKDKWELTSEASLSVGAGGGSFQTEVDENGNKITGFDLGNAGLGGVGAGIDLGATYKVIDNLIVSAAVLDLGFISWKQTLQGATINKTFTYEGFEDFKINTDNEDDPQSLGNQFSDLSDDLVGLINLYDEGAVSGEITGLASTINIGADYTMPFYDKLSIGILSSTRLNKEYTWTEGRLGATVMPLEWFDFSLNYGISKHGSSMGWIMNIHPKGFNLFIGSDNMLTKVTPQFIPVNNLKANIYAGINITFGEKQ